MSDSAVEKGIVARIKEDKALVRLLQADACEQCGARIFCRPTPEGERELWVVNSINAEAGEHVKIVETDNFMLRLALMQFGVPLLGLVSGILITGCFDTSSFFIPKELAMFFGGVIGLFVGGLTTWNWSRHRAKGMTCIFEIEEIV